MPTIMRGSTKYPIGVFDSGLGGLTVLQALTQALPQEDFIYLGDTARVPYGARSARIVQRYSQENVHFLLQHHVKLIVIACNTATAYAEDMLRRNCPSELPIIGVIQPGVDALLQSTHNKRVAVIGTRATIKSNAYQQHIAVRDATIQVHAQACPLFVPLVEEGWLDGLITDAIIQKYFAELLPHEIDSVILACTHYPLLKPAIAQLFPQLQLIDSALETGKAVQHCLVKKKQLAPSTATKAKVRIYLTDLDAQEKHLQNFLRELHYDSLEEVQLS